MAEKKEISKGVKISVVIPAYNEEKVIVSTLKEVDDFLQARFGQGNYEIIVVDDCSQDSTFPFASAFTGIRVFRNLKNHGKGYTVAKGVAQAQGEWVLFMDADNSTRISELNNFWPYTSDYKLLIASRALKESKVEIKQNAFKVFFGKLGNLVSQALIYPGIKDTQCGFKLLATELKPLFAQLTISGFAFDFELMFLARKNKLAVKELPVSWYNNFDSSVKWFDYPKTMLHILKIRINDTFGRYEL
ncbi:MAG: glycosyltransferase [Patescibacteria group bacterium]|nr:glycosyltransferase [Patescibacteria group bacterium]